MRLEMEDLGVGDLEGNRFLKGRGFVPWSLSREFIMNPARLAGSWALCVTFSVMGEWMSHR